MFSLRAVHMACHCRPTIFIILSAEQTTLGHVSAADVQPTLTADSIGRYFDVMSVNQHVGPCVRGADIVYFMLW